MKRKTWKKEGRALAGLLGLLVSLSVCVWGLWTPLPVLAGDAEKETGQAKETEETEIQGADERGIQEEITWTISVRWKKVSQAVQNHGYQYNHELAKLETVKPCH